VSDSSSISVVSSVSLGAARLTLNRSQLKFFGSATAGNATIVSDSSTIGVFESASLGTARLTLDGSQLDSSGLTVGHTTLGSLDGNGNVFLGNKLLEIGGNNLSTTFAGKISGESGALTKDGTGALTLTGTSTYTGATVIRGGTLVVDGS